MMKSDPSLRLHRTPGRALMVWYAPSPHRILELPALRLAEPHHPSTAISTHDRLLQFGVPQGCETATVHTLIIIGIAASVQIPGSSNSRFSGASLYLG